ncbi:hypothetical protein [Streptomyces sp. NPDC055085]
MQLAVSIALWARSVLEGEQLALHHERLTGPIVSGSTVHRTLDMLDDQLAAIARARAEVRRVVWVLADAAARWISLADHRRETPAQLGSRRMNATIITAASKKHGAAATWKKTFSFHPSAAWCVNTGECLSMPLRPGSAGFSTVSAHKTVLADALAQIRSSPTAKLLARVDGAGTAHGLHEHLAAPNARRRAAEFATGWTITDGDDRAIAKLPEAARDAS